MSMIACMARSRRHKKAIEAYRKASGAGSDSTEQNVSDGAANAEPRSPDSSFPVFEKTTKRPEIDPAIFEKLGVGGVDRAARLLIALGTEKAAAVLAHLEQDEVERIARAIIQTEKVHRGELEIELASTPPPPVLKGGPEFARSILVTSFGEDAGERIFLRAVPNAPEAHFDFLNEMEGPQLVTLLKEESPGAVAVILTHLDRSRAAAVMKGLGPAMKSEIVRRIAHLGRLDRDVVVRIEDAVKAKIRSQGTRVTEEVDGGATLAAILRNMEPGTGDDILRALAVADESLAESIRDQILTIDTLLEVSRKDLATLLREFDDVQIATFLRGKSEELRRRVLEAVSERRKVTISEEYRHQGPQRREDVEQVTREVLDRVRQMEEDGIILVARGDDRYI
jgi:flagellar motor switch protein FliG